MKKIIIICSAMFCLTGCSAIADSTPVTLYHNSSTTAKTGMVGATGGAAVGAVGIGGASGALVGGVIGAAAGTMIGAYLEKNQTQVERVESRNVEVLRLGDYVKLIIPSSQLFSGYSADLSMGADSTLDAVVALVGPMPKVAIAVSAYTDDQWGYYEEEVELSTAQAQAVANYLWHNGVDTRLISAMGFGNQRPLTYDEDRLEQNDRVEITLRDLSNS